MKKGGNNGGSRAQGFSPYVFLGILWMDLDFCILLCCSAALCFFVPCHIFIINHNNTTSYCQPRISGF